MPIFAGALTAAAGLFLFLWLRTVASLPAARQPRFIGRTSFRWGVLAISIALFVTGTYLLALASFMAGLVALVTAPTVVLLVVKFDPYSAGMRIMYGDYKQLRRANPDLCQPDLLFRTACRAYPGWSEDRVVELVAGKDIESLMLLTAIRKHGVNPITDWELYRALRKKASRIARRETSQS